MQISLEIVPRSTESLLNDIRTAETCTQIDVINIPDLLRFPVRAWDACATLNRNIPNGAPRKKLIPHIRAIDFDLSKEFPYKELFKEAKIDSVLVVAGDPPQDMRHTVFPTKTVDFIGKLKKEMPHLEVYAAFDPYRTNIRFELDYLKAKEEAGADGFMSQPFFDLRLMEIYAEYLSGKKVFWGISPVTSEKSRNYWETRNRAIFPKSFKAELDWNIQFGRSVLEYCRKEHFDLYMMPIRIKLDDYLHGLFS